MEFSGTTPINIPILGELTYRDYIDIEGLKKRITELNAGGKMDKEIAATLNREGFVAARACAFKGENVWLLRTRWGIPTVKINGVAPNPMRWPDGTFSVQGAAATLGITTQTVFDCLERGLLSGTSSRKGNHDKSNSRTSRSIDFVLTCDASDVRRRHHENLGSPKTLDHSPKARLVVTMIVTTTPRTDVGAGASKPRSSTKATY